MKCVLIVNKTSGKGKILKYKNYILKKLSERFEEITWLETEYKGHGTILAQEFSSKCDCMIVAGGDGTLNEVINGIIKSENKPILAQIPSGTVNDFSSSLGFRKNIKKTVKQLLSATETEVDVFSSKEKVGIYICGLGVFTQTSYTASQKKKNKFGVISYFFNGIKEIKTYVPQKVEIEYDDKKYIGKAALMLAINSKSVGGFKFNKNAKLDDNKLDFVLISAKKDKISLSDLLLIAKLFLFGTRSIRKNKRVICDQISNLHIISSENMHINFDGEFAGDKREFSINIGTNKLKFLKAQNR